MSGEASPRASLEAWPAVRGPSASRGLASAPPQREPGCQPPSPATTAAGPATTAVTPAVLSVTPPPVAEGRIVDNAVATVPVTLHGRGLTFVADLRAQYTLVRSALLDLAPRLAYDPQRANSSPLISISIVRITLDSLRIGTFLLHHPAVVAVAPVVFPPLPVPVPDVAGWIGPGLLSMFDLEFDLPAQRVRLYRTEIGTSDSTGQLPRGLTTADCTPGRIYMAGSGLELDFQVQANGKVLPSHFDAKTAETSMNWSAAKMVGVTPQDVDATGLLHHITLQIGARTLAAVPIRITGHLPADETEEPMLALGLAISFHDRRLFIAYSTARSCVSPP